MPKAYDTWTVHPHAAIEKLTENLWRVEGSLPDMPLKRVMTLVKLEDGTLLVHNAVALSDEAMREIDAWGAVQFLVVPNGYHRLDAAVFAARYPQAKVFAPKGQLAKVQEVVPRACAYEEFEADSRVGLEYVDGTKQGEAVFVITSNDGVSLIFNDLIFNMPHVGGFKGFVLKHLTASTGGPKVSRIARLLLVKDKRAVRSHLERLATTPRLRRSIVSHHLTIGGDVGDCLRKVAMTL